MWLLFKCKTTIATMSFSTIVTRSLAELIPPCSPTPGGKLPLSPIDSFPFYFNSFPMLIVFEGGLGLGKAIRSGLSKALVPYYPVAGKVFLNDAGAGFVECTGEGVLLVEARISCTLKDVDYLRDPHRIPSKELLPIEALEDRILMIQVTEFECGGYTVCYNFHHMVFDGYGIAQFLKAVGEMARGFQHPTTRPVWDRDLMPGSSIKGLQPSSGPLQLAHVTMDISHDTINILKAQFGHNCTVFDVVAAAIWQCRTRAIACDPTIELSFVFLMNVRRLLRCQEGYYGNCLIARSITETSGTIANAPFSYLVGLIQKCKKNLDTVFWKWVKGGQDGGTPTVTLTNYETLIISDIRQLGFYDVDFDSQGGPALHVPLARLDYCPFIFSCNLPAKSNGVRLVTNCVKDHHLKAFCDQINSIGIIPTFNPQL